MREQRTQRTVRRRIATAAMAIGVVLFGIAVAPGVASAHHAILTGQTQCRVDSWSVTWTARADADRANMTWSITSPGGYSPAGSQADELPFTRTVSYPASQASATETVSASWSNNATGGGTATVPRPELCQVATTTTTQPAVTTTTQPAVTTTTPVDETPTTLAATTTTVEQAGPETSVGQQGPTSTVDQSSGAAADPTTTVGVSRGLPATGASDGMSLTVIALTLIGIGAVMLRLTSKPTR